MEKTQTELLVKISLGLGIVAILMSAFAIFNFNEKNFDILAEGYAERLEAKMEEEERASVAEGLKPISENEHIFGYKNAEITIFEYSDFECPFCKRFSGTPSGVVENSGKKVNFVYRHFPISGMNSLAAKQAHAVECAGEISGSEKFFKFKTEIFKKTNSAGNGMEESGLFDIAKNLNIDINEFRACMDENRHMKKIEDDIASGMEAGVKGTPGVIIRNNKTGEVRIMRGAVPAETIEEAILELSK